MIAIAIAPRFKRIWQKSRGAPGEGQDGTPRALGGSGTPMLNDTESESPLGRASEVPNGRLASIWEALVEGRTRILAEFLSSERAGLVLGDVAAAPDDRALSLRERHVLELVVLSRSQKAAAIDLNLSQQSVASVLQKSFQKMGLACTYRSAPVLLILIVLAVRRSIQLPRVSIEWTELDSRPVRLLSADRPDAHLDDRLSPAERAVAHMMIDGRSHEQIASVRRTSRRTIANQIAAIHAKLGASGRMDLISRLSAAGALPPGSRERSLLSNRVAGNLY